MTQQYLKQQNVTFEIMIKNDAAYLPNSVNNYVGATQEGTIWPATGDSTDDTSRFQLPFRIENMVKFQVVAVNIINNNTVNSVRPEYIEVENFNSAHSIVSSKGSTIDNIIAILNTTTDFEKTYGSLQLTCNFDQSVKKNSLNIRLLDANHQPFSLASELTHDGTQRAFQMLLTVAFYSVE
tara:strand:+ start:2321 stop:2863 length:543 start_codon:yes stop_codon:yes gene_type:complete